MDCVNDKGPSHFCAGPCSGLVLSLLGRGADRLDHVTLAQDVAESVRERRILGLDGLDPRAWDPHRPFHVHRHAAEFWRAAHLFTFARLARSAPCGRLLGFGFGLFRHFVTPC